MSTREVVLSILLMAFLFLSSQSEVATGHQESSMCGLSKVDHSRLRIIGGRLAEDGEFPWHAAMFRIYKSSDVPPIYICGASIIDTHWLLTAAHCVHRQRAKNIQVGIGSKSLKGAKMVQVVKILSHPDYNPVTYENDIALLKVSKPLEISNVGFINHICLPGEVELDTKKAEEIQEEAEFFGNKRATVAGFGFKDRHTEEEELMAVDVQVFNRSYCLKQYQTKFRKHMICAGSLKGGQDSCQGDSGGSLIRRINGQAVIVGVVSWGVGCGRKDFPGVYTDVNNYVKWIKSATGQPKRNSKQLSNNIESHDFGKPDELTLPPLPTLQVSHLDNECLGSHNYLRALHYAPKLKTDPQLVKIAKRISSQLLNMNKLEFRKFHKFGQNIARYYGREPSCKEVVQFWYGDGRSYDYNRPGYSPKTGTFTQIVWKSSRRLGCAKAKGNGNNFGVVCLYDPPGNMRRHFEENVQPPFSYQENNL